jgi:hypothetical protein
MPIKPIDLQTLFSQLDRVGREQSAGKDGAAIQGAVHGAAMQKRAEERARSVQKAPDSDESESAKVSADGEGGAGTGGEAPAGEGEKEGDREGKPEIEIIRDPGLGTKVDLSG